MRPSIRPDIDDAFDSLEVRLRQLTPPPIPEGLESRLLAAIPASVRRRSNTPSGGRAVLAGATSALALACSLAVFLSFESSVWTGDPKLVGSDRKNKSFRVAVTNRPNDALTTVAWFRGRQGIEGAEPPTFTWPIREKLPLMVSISVPSDLFD